MITRDVGAVRPIAAFKSLSFDASCGSLNGDSTANLLIGFIVDRLGLGRAYHSVLVEAHLDMDIGTTTVDTKAAFVSAWLFHSSTTVAANFTLVSTELGRLSRQPAFAFLGPTTTSTLASGYMATSTSVGTFGTFSATATGSARASYAGAYNADNLHRFLQLQVLVEAYASSSGGSALRPSASFVFGEPDDVIPQPTTTTGAGTAPWLS